MIVLQIYGNNNLDKNLKKKTKEKGRKQQQQQQREIQQQALSPTFQYTMMNEQKAAQLLFVVCMDSHNTLTIAKQRDNCSP